MQVVMPVLGCPPENAFLSAALGQEREDELEYPAGGIGAVRKVSMVARPDGEHP
jgi:hypothetical protein